MTRVLPSVLATALIWQSAGMPTSTAVTIAAAQAADVAVDCPGGGRGVTVAPNAYNAFAGTRGCGQHALPPAQTPASSGPRKPRICAETIAATAVAGVLGQAAAAAEAIGGVPVI